VPLVSRSRRLWRISAVIAGLRRADLARHPIFI
jgi:hypothetical protein